MAAGRSKETATRKESALATGLRNAEVYATHASVVHVTCERDGTC